MSAAQRQRHLGVFVLGTGNHSAGWRYPGAAVSNLDRAVTQEIARIADIPEEWFVTGAAEGFNILPPHFSGAFADFVDLVVPELQHRRLYRREYRGTTLRDHLGLARIPAPATRDRAVGDA